MFSAPNRNGSYAAVNCASGEGNEVFGVDLRIMRRDRRRLKQA
jgi:hypothetical protein